MATAKLTWTNLWLSIALFLGLFTVPFYADSRVPFQPNCSQCEGIFDIKGQKLYLEKIGNRGPYVVFESGLGNNSSSWKSIAPKVSNFAQVILYDRSGLGQSSPRIIHSHLPVTADTVATALNQLLKRARFRPPYILVGHSLGGLYAQMFARKYPQEVAGVILIDSASPNEPDGVFVSKVKPPMGTIDYFEDAGVSESNQQVRNAGSFPDVPLTVITATDHGSDFRSKESWWMELQRGLASMSPDGTHIIAQGSGHFVQNNRPELVIDAIKAMVLKVEERSERCSSKIADSLEGSIHRPSGVQ
jgi:predicted alpha/beta hydrolase family esterase